MVQLDWKMNICRMMMLRVKLSKERMLTMSTKTSWQQEFENQVGTKDEGELRNHKVSTPSLGVSCISFHYLVHQ